MASSPSQSRAAVTAADAAHECEGGRPLPMQTEPRYRYRESLTATARYGPRRCVRATRQRRRRLMVAVTVIALLVPAGILSLQSLWTSLNDNQVDPEMITEAVQAPRLDPNDPFDGTPAKHYPTGADGIVLPPATPLGTWKATDVQYVLDRTRQTLVAGRLDPAALVQRDPTKYLTALAVSARRPTQTEIGKGAPALGYVTRLAPGYSLAAPVRTKGTLSVGVGPQKQLVVTADVVWVYPLRAPTGGQPRGAGARLVVVRTVESYQWFPSKGYAKVDRGLRPGAGDQALYNVDCALAGQGLLALPRTRGAGRAAADPKAYDLATPLTEFPASC